MTEEQYIPNLDRRKGSHLTEAEMNQIQAYKITGMSNRNIAKKIGCSRQTINNAIKNNSVVQKYRVRIANKVYEYEKMVYYADTHWANYNKNRSYCGRKSKWIDCEDFLNWADKKMNPKNLGFYSPDQCVGRAKREKKFKSSNIPCTKTLYNWINQGILKTKNEDLREKLYRKPQKKAYRKENKRVLGESIENRPIEIETREEFGHWEIDTVIGKKRKSDPVLLTLVERKTRYEWTVKINRKTMTHVNNALKEILLLDELGVQREIFKTITSDNGSEFSGLTDLLNYVDAYFCHPYSSYERGTSENQHRLIRRFIGKGKSIADYSESQILRMNNYINNYPRKILDYATAEEAFIEEVKLLLDSRQVA